MNTNFFSKRRSEIKSKIENKIINVTKICPNQISLIFAREGMTPAHAHPPRSADQRPCRSRWSPGPTSETCLTRRWRICCQRWGSSRIWRTDGPPERTSSVRLGGSKIWFHIFIFPCVSWGLCVCVCIDRGDETFQSAICRRKSEFQSERARACQREERLPGDNKQCLTGTRALCFGPRQHTSSSSSSPDFLAHFQITLVRCRILNKGQVSNFTCWSRLMKYIAACWTCCNSFFNQ